MLYTIYNGIARIAAMAGLTASGHVLVRRSTVPHYYYDVMLFPIRLGEQDRIEVTLRLGGREWCRGANSGRRARALCA